MKRTSCRRRLAIASVLVVTLAACGGGSGGLEVTEAWARTSPAMAEAGAAYMQITNGAEPMTPSSACRWTRRWRDPPRSTRP